MNVTSTGTLGLAVLLLAGCQNIPYYDETLDWFSWSRYDAEVDAIEAEIPPPGALQAQPPTSGDLAAPGVSDARGGHVFVEPPSATVSLGALPLASRNVASSAPAGTASAPASGTAQTNLGDPLVGIRNSIAPSVTWRSPRGAS